MSVHLRPETEARLTALAAASGVSVDDYLAALVEREAPGNEPASPPEFRKTLFRPAVGNVRNTISETPPREGVL